MIDLRISGPFGEQYFVRHGEGVGTRPYWRMSFDRSNMAFDIYGSLGDGYAFNSIPHSGPWGLWATELTHGPRGGCHSFPGFGGFKPMGVADGGTTGALLAGMLGLGCLARKKHASRNAFSES